MEFWTLMHERVKFHQANIRGGSVIIMGLEFGGFFGECSSPQKNCPIVLPFLSSVAYNMPCMKLRQENYCSDKWLQICGIPCQTNEHGELTLINNLKGPI